MYTTVSPLEERQDKKNVLKGINRLCVWMDILGTFQGPNLVWSSGSVFQHKSFAVLCLPACLSVCIRTFGITL